MEQRNYGTIRLTVILCCPVCGSSLDNREAVLVCKNTSCGRSFSKVGNIYNFLPEKIEKDVGLSKEKWDKFYIEKKQRTSYEDQYKVYMEDNFENVYKQIIKYKEFNKDTVFLEIGCGPMLLARALSSKCKLVIGIDFSLEALKLGEKMLEEKGIHNYLLILGDIQNMPIKDNQVDILYGGGVIEHIENTYDTVKELYRVLKSGGISFNTVPSLNIGSLTYRQLWGNIPNFPVLKQLAELIHIKILRSRHMIFGYEFSFLASHIKWLHKKAGFKKVYVDKFETKLMFEFVPIKFVRKIFIYLADKSPFFWPMIKVVGIK